MESKFYQCVQNDNINGNILDTIWAIRQADFDGVFVQIYDNPFWSVTQEEQVALCKKLNMPILFAHLGYYLIDDMWQEGEEGDRRQALYMQDIDYCHKNDINMVVMHVCSNRKNGAPNRIGLKRYQEIVDYASSLGVKVAFENTKNLEYFEYIVDHIKGDNAGVCLDSGHYHCFYENEFDWDKVKDKILAVHLHDNNGKDDQHLNIFDGNLDWEALESRLEEAGYNGPITLESFYSEAYKGVNLNDFYLDSISRAKDLEKTVLQI